MEQVWSTLDLSSTLPGTGSVGNSVADGSASACPAHDLIEIMISSSFLLKFFLLLLVPSPLPGAGADADEPELQPAHNH